ARQSVAEADPRRKVAGDPHHERTGEAQHEICAVAFRSWREVAPIAGLRGNEERAAHLVVVRREPKPLSAEGVTDIDEGLAGIEPGSEIDPRRQVERGPVAHPPGKSAKRFRPRSAYAPVIEGQRIEAAFGEIGREA